MVKEKGTKMTGSAALVGKRGGGKSISRRREKEKGDDVGEGERLNGGEWITLHVNPRGGNQKKKKVSRITKKN